MRKDGSTPKYLTIGLNSGVVKDINEAGVYIGTPAKKIK